MIFSQSKLSYWFNKRLSSSLLTKITKSLFAGLLSVLFLTPALCWAASVGNAVIKRAEISKPLLLAIYGSDYIPAAATGAIYTDVQLGDLNADWIEKLEADGITEGCAVTLFCPNMVITRVQLAIILLKAKHGSTYLPPISSGSLFTDVPSGSFAVNWIETLVDQGIADGCDADKFCPNEVVTVEVFNKMLSNAFLIVGLLKIKQFFNYGQSLSLGVKASPLLSSSQPYKNIMFNGGLTARANPGKLTSFIPLVESRDVETQSSATANNITKLIENENGIDFNDQADVYLASNPGAGARKISELSKGSIFYDTILIQTQAAKDISQGLGIPHQVSFMTFMQGESNYTNPPMPAITYATALSKLINDLNTDVSEITNQLTSFPLINYQIASHRFYSKTIPTVALGHLLASKIDSNIHLAVPMYIFDYVDNLHTDNQSNRQIGNYFARTYKRVAIDNLDWKPLRPSTVDWQVKTVDIKFDVPVGPIVFDTSWVSAEVNQGFDIWNSDFSLMLDIIQSVTVVEQDTVRISMSMEPPIGSYVTYAFGRDAHNGFSGRTLGPRGNLRDSAGDNDSGPYGRMDNYSVIFSEQKM